MYIMLIWHRGGPGAVHLSVRTSSSHIGMELGPDPAR